MRRPSPLLHVLLLLPACSLTPSEPYTADTHPDVSAEDLRCVVVLSHDGPGTGSGIVIRPDVVLTAKHVVEAFTDDLGSPFRVRIGFGWHEARISAAGETDWTEDDWAVLEITPPLDPGTVPTAELFAPATAPGYHPVARQDVFLAGYATRFYEDRLVDPRLPVPLVVTRFKFVEIPLGDSPGSWILDDRELELAGMSGGGVFVWNEATRRPELAGVFVARSEENSDLEGPFGFTMRLSSSSALQAVPLPAGLGD